MSRRETTPDFDVPTPEELEQGILPFGKKARRGERLRKDTERPDRRRVKRVFSRLRRGVGQKRTEAPAPAPPPLPLATTEPDEQPTAAPVESSGHSSVSPAPPEALTESPARSRTKPSELRPTAGTSTGKVRRIRVPGRTPDTAPARVPSPVPDYLTEQSRQLGHRLTPFEQKAGIDPQEMRYVAKCLSCNAVAIARRTAPPNFTMKDSGSWERLSGYASERRCSP